jgi:hypothetical protein
MIKQPISLAVEVLTQVLQADLISLWFAKDSDLPLNLRSVPIYSKWFLPFIFSKPKFYAIARLPL